MQPVRARMNGTLGRRKTADYVVMPENRHLERPFCSSLRFDRKWPIVVAFIKRATSIKTQRQMAPGDRLDPASQNENGPPRGEPFLELVAGAGFEPATFGL